MSDNIPFISDIVNDIILTFSYLRVEKVKTPLTGALPRHNLLVSNIRESYKWHCTSLEKR